MPPLVSRLGSGSQSISSGVPFSPWDVPSRGSPTASVAARSLLIRTDMDGSGAPFSAPSSASFSPVGTLPSVSRLHHTNSLPTPSSLTDDDEPPSSSPPGKSERAPSLGSNFFQPFSDALLVIQGLPETFSPRDAALMFTFATDYISCDVHEGEGSLTARFRTHSGAKSAQATLERRTDIFGTLLRCEVRQIGAKKSRFQFASVESPRDDSPPDIASPLSLFGQQPSQRVHDGVASLSLEPPAATHSLFHGASHLRNSTHSHLQQRPQSPPLSAASQGSYSAVQPSSAPRSASAASSSASGQRRTSRHDSVPEMSKVVMSYTPANSAKALSIMQQGGRVLPPANPADQNPPCNTLYVGNLPPDTQEEELKEIFSVRPGYKRLCFRTKQNGPMCFVEFEDEHFAGEALRELYGFGLSNSVKGGIRLSYSKNPLGVRSSRTK